AVEHRSRGAVRRDGDDAPVQGVDQAPGERRELAAQLPGPERLLAQVGQSPAAGETAEVTDLDGYHIRRSGAGSQRGQQRIVVVLEAEGLHLQLDVRVHFLEERAYFSHKGVVVREHADGELG